MDITSLDRPSTLAAKPTMECKDGYCTYWTECRHCGDFIKREEGVSQAGLHKQVVCNSCWDDAVQWHLKGYSYEKIAAQLGVGRTSVQDYLSRRHFVPEEAFRERQRRAAARHVAKASPGSDANRKRAYRTTDRGKLSTKSGNDLLSQRRQTEEGRIKYNAYMRDYYKKQKDKEKEFAQHGSI